MVGGGLGLVMTVLGWEWVGASDDSVRVGGGLGLMMTVLWLGVGWG